MNTTTWPAQLRSRRYLKTDRATYIQQNGVVPH